MAQQLTNADRQFLATVQNYLFANDLRCIKDDPHDGWQLVVQFKHVPLSKASLSGSKTGISSPRPNRSHTYAP